jgi:hypothetical protein
MSTAGENGIGFGNSSKGRNRSELSTRPYAHVYCEERGHNVRQTIRRRRS